MAGKFILGMISGGLVVASALILGSALYPARPANVAPPAEPAAPAPVEAGSDAATTRETTTPEVPSATETAPADPTPEPQLDAPATEAVQPSEPASPPVVEAAAEAVQPDAPIVSEVAPPETQPEPSKPAETLADAAAVAPATPEPLPETLLAQADVQDAPPPPASVEEQAEPIPAPADPEAVESMPAPADEAEAIAPAPAAPEEPAPVPMAEADATEPTPATDLSDTDIAAPETPGPDSPDSGDLAIDLPALEPVPDEAGPVATEVALPGDPVPDLPGTPPEALPSAPETELQPAPETASRGSTFRPAPGLPRAGDGGDGAETAAEDAQPADPGAAADDPRPIAQFAADFENPGGKPTFAIVLIDDGSEGLDRAGLATLPFPASVALDPLDPAAAERATAYRAAGKEVVMLATGIAEGAQPSDVEVAFQSMEQGLPDAVAVMDLAEPGFQNKRLLAATVVPILKAQGRGLLTWDTGLNAADQVARREDLESAVIFRDLGSAGEDRAAIRRLLDRAVFKAGQEGRVSVVGRADPAIVAALLEWAIEGKAATVALAPLTAVLRVD